MSAGSKAPRAGERVVVPPGPMARPPRVREAIDELRALIDVSDNYVFNVDQLTFGDLRQIIGYAERALEALKGG